MGDDTAWAAAELGTELRGGPADAVRSFAGLIDDERGRAMLNYYDSLLGPPVEETRIGKEIIANYATDTVDTAVKSGAISQMKAATGVTNQNQDGKDFYGEAATQLEHEGAIGIVFGPPGAGKTATTIDVGGAWRARTGGAVIGNTSYSGFDRQFSSDSEMLEAMGSIEGPVLAIVDEVAQELSGFGEGSVAAEAFSDALLFVRKKEEQHGEYAKKGSVLLVGHTRKKVAKSIRRVASFGIEKPYRGQPDKARLLQTEGGKDTWDENGSYQGLTDTAETYAEYEPSEFEITEAVDDDEDEQTIDLDKQKKQEAIKTVVRASQQQDMTYDEAAGLVDYQEYWVGERVREWKSGDHDFVDIERP